MRMREQAMGNEDRKYGQYHQNDSNHTQDRTWPAGPVRSEAA